MHCAQKVTLDVDRLQKWLYLDNIVALERRISITLHHNNLECLREIYDGVGIQTLTYTVFNNFPLPINTLSPGWCTLSIGGNLW